MTMPPLITQQYFTQCLVGGIPIPGQDQPALDDFGERLIRWINDTPNEYWACWKPGSEGKRILIDLRSTEIINLQLDPGILIFQRPGDGTIAEALPAEFGNAAIGVMLFCMIENGQIEEVPLENIPAADRVPVAKATKPPPRSQAKTKPPTRAGRKSRPNFDWI